MTGIAIPETSEELEEFFHDDKRLTDVLKNGQFGDFTRAYIAAAMSNQRAELAAQMRDQLQTGQQQILQDWAAQGMTPASGFRPGGPAVSARDARRNRAVAKSRRADAEFQAEKQCAFNPAALGAAVDDEDYAQSMRSFMYNMWKAEHVARESGEGERVEVIRGYKKQLFDALQAGSRPQNAAMSERIPAEGGFLVPEVLRSEILMIALEQSAVRPRARVIPMDSLTVPLPMIDDTSHVSNVYGGVAAYWTAEGATLSATAPSFGRLDLTARKLTAYTTIPNELLQDSITPLDTWFNMFFPRAMAWFEDLAFISGTGVGEPQGFLNSPAAIRVPLTGGHVNTLTFSAIAQAYSQMWPASLNSAVWLCSPDTLQQLMQIAVSAPQGSSPTYTTVAPPGWLTLDQQAIGYPGGGNGDGVNYRLLGRPLIVSEKMPSSGSSNSTTPGALTFVDLDYYLLGDRQAMQIATSEEYLFASDLVAYRVIERLDGRIWQQSAITPANGGPALSTVVKIDTTATS
jgi:HK97 family phage major capsid protein